MPYAPAFGSARGSRQCQMERSGKRKEKMEQKLHYRMTIRLWKEDKAFGPGICRLLEEIERTGSMHQAAAEMGLAYSKAWKMMKTAERELGFLLTERSSGGRMGGGSKVTEKRTGDHDKVSGV